MKHIHHTTPEEAGPTLGAIGRWLVSLNQLHQCLRSHFARPEPYQHVLLYLQAILSEIPRKNGWQMAEHARQLRPYGMQRLLSHAVWDEAGVRDELRALVCHTLQPPPVEPARADPAALFPILVLDESGFPKRGRHSAGVANQYCGASGRVENCQVGVFLSYVTALGHALIDRELYLPEDWCSDLPRRQAAHIPDTLTFETKPELAIRMIQRAQPARLPIPWSLLPQPRPCPPSCRPLARVGTLKRTCKPVKSWAWISMKCAALSVGIVISPSSCSPMPSWLGSVSRKATLALLKTSPLLPRREFR